jgi:REP element-mobilizing transposase RayT
MLPFHRDGRWGGARPGAGRKKLPTSQRKGVPHRARESLNGRDPVHVTVRVRKGLRGLRAKRTYAVIRRCFELGCDRFGFRLVQFSVQSNHLHLICEAENRGAMTRGMKGLLVRIARALNRLWERRGSVFEGRYHEHVLTSPRQVRNALAYVLNNLWKHLGRVSSKHAVDGVDRYSSGSWFGGWRGGHTAGAGADGGAGPPVCAARSWLLATGWRRHGLISVDEVPSRLR